MGGGLDMGHARALLALDGAQQIAAANKIAADGLSVREAEKLVQDLLSPIPQHKKVMTQSRYAAITGRYCPESRHQRTNQGR